MDLLAALREARGPYDEAREEAAAERREREAQCDRLRTDPEALRKHLRPYRHRDWNIKSLGERGAAALEVTLERDGPLTDVEHRALAALGSLFADPLNLRLAEREASDGERWAFDELYENHHEDQRRTIFELAGRFGDGPQLREVSRRLNAGELLRDSEASWLECRAEEDRDSRAEQKRLAADYFGWREEETRRLLKAQASPPGSPRGPRTFSTGSTAVRFADASPARRSSTPIPNDREAMGRQAGGRRALPLLCHHDARRARGRGRAVIVPGTNASPKRPNRGDLRSRGHGARRVAPMPSRPPAPKRERRDSNPRPPA